MMISAKEKMNLIQQTFREGKEHAAEVDNLQELNEFLLKIPNEYISVAYEGASMGVAIQSLEKYGTLESWHKFYNDFGLMHSTQMHIGLGWAIAELNTTLSSLKAEIPPSLAYRVYDGFGYYEGVLRRRKAIRMHELPNLSSLNLKAYDQGLGRSLWYISQGGVGKLVRMINLFEENRLYDLWRGVGVAVAYVGGVGEEELNELLIAAGNNKTSFKCGVSLLAQSRNKAQTVSNDTNLICNYLLGLNCKKIDDELVIIEKSLTSEPALMYFEWLKKIEQELCVYNNVYVKNTYNI